MAVSCFVFGIQGASHLKEGGLFWLQQPNMGMKLKKIIKEIENNDESTITVDKANYIALLREVNRLRFKCSQRGALSRSKKMSSKDNSDEPEAVLKHLCNYCFMPGQEKAILKTGKTLEQFVAGLGLDGIELLVYRNVPYFESFEHLAVGVHLNYWPMWLAMYRNDKEVLSRFFTSKDALKDYYGTTYCMGWLRNIRDNIKAALVENPEYLVWHVAECTFEEVFTFKFEHSDMDVVTAAAAVFNRVADEVPEDVLVLFENLWWPGLRLTEPAVVRAFFEKIKHKNVGIMLDTGHLMNTNPELQTEEDGIEYILKTVKALGEDRKLIRGLHLNCSLSGDYVKTFERVFDSESSNIERMKHVIKIDQHRPFTDKAVQKLLRFIKPDYVVHELAYRDFSDFEKNIEVQLTACGRKLSIDDEGD